MILAFGAAAHAEVMWESAGAGCSSAGNTVLGPFGSAEIQNVSGTQANVVCPVFIRNYSSSSYTACYFNVIIEGTSNTYGGVEPLLQGIVNGTGVVSSIANTTGTVTTSATYGGVSYTFSPSVLDFNNDTYYVSVQLTGNTPSHSTIQSFFQASITCF